MWTNLQILAGLFTFITVIFRKAPLFAKWKLINIHLKSDHLRSYFWSEYRKIRTRNNSVFRHVSRSVFIIAYRQVIFRLKLKDLDFNRSFLGTKSRVNESKLNVGYIYISLRLCSLKNCRRWAVTNKNYWKHIKK